MFALFRSREKTVRILLGVFLGLVALSMLIYLVPGAPGMGGTTGENTVATVGDQKITVQDVQTSIQRMTQGQANIPRALIAGYIPTMVNQLISSKAMSVKAHEVGLTVSDQELANSIQSEYASQLGGPFDMTRYEAALSSQGLTPAQYEKERREEMLAQRLDALETQSLVVSEDEAKAEYQKKNQKVGLQYIGFDSKDFASRVTKSPEILKAYFDKNRAQFRTPERRDVDLLLGTATDFMATAKVSDADLQKRYQESIDSYRTPERVNVRHILIKTQGKPKGDVPALKAKADQILKQLQGGADFAELAKRNSDDPGSAVKGGDLGWIIRGQTVPNFEKAAFSLDPKKLSNVVETEYGYHILEVMDKQAAHTQTLDEVKPQLMAETQREAATDNVRKAADAARTEIAKSPGQDLEIAKKYNLKFLKLTGITANGTLPVINAQPELMTSLFSLQKGGTSNVIPVENGNRDAFGVVTNIYAAHNSSYEEAQQEVADRYSSTEANRLAQEAAKSAAEKARKGDSLESIAKSDNLAVKTAAPFTADGAAEGIGAASYLSDAFKAPVGGVVGPVSVGSSQFVCKVADKIQADMGEFAKNRDALTQSLITQKKSLQQSLFRQNIVADLKRRGKIKMNDAALSRMISAFQS